VDGSGNNTGGIAGSTVIWVEIENCRNNGTVTGTGNHTGGIAGWIEDSTTIAACSNSGKVESSGSNYTGGIVGYIENGAFDQSGNGIPMPSDVQACRNDGPVHGFNHTGGVAGYVGNRDKITACYNTAEVSDNGYPGCPGYTGYTGGVVGSYIASISACYNTGAVSGGSNTGGVAGGALSSNSNHSRTGLLEACYWDAYVPTPAQYGIGDSNSDMEAEPFSSFSRNFPDIRTLSLSNIGWRTGNGNNGGYWRSGTGTGGLPPRLWWE
jgi:hypothetical protein